MSPFLSSKKVIGKLLPGAFLLPVICAGKQGYAEGGLSGAAQAALREQFEAELVESAANAWANSVEELFAPGGLDAAAERIKKKRFGDLLD